MLPFEETFGIPAGHSLREVRSAPCRRPAGRCWEWEHEEYDARGALVAVYECRVPSDVPPAAARAGMAFVKYSPWGWVLYRSDGKPPPPPQRASSTPAKLQAV
jgi:hypothetical protein